MGFRSPYLVLEIASLVLVSVIPSCAHSSKTSANSGGVSGTVAYRERAEATPSMIWGTAWLLEDLGGSGVLDRVQATLEFPEPGKAAGNGSCNRFFGTVEVSGESITFGRLGSTRMACVEAVAMQEGKYLKALEAAERFAIDGSILLIYSKGMDKPLRFTRTAP